jgi:hypothetical protein
MIPIYVLDYFFDDLSFFSSVSRRRYQYFELPDWLAHVLLALPSLLVRRRRQARGHRDPVGTPCFKGGNCYKHWVRTDFRGCRKSIPQLNPKSNTKRSRKRRASNRDGATGKPEPGAATSPLSIRKEFQLGKTPRVSLRHTCCEINSGSVLVLWF